MIKLSGIFSESFGGTCTLRGYATYEDIVSISYPHEAYQRKEDAKHIEDISKFISSGMNSFSPEVVLAYTVQYDFNKPGAESGIDPLTDIRSGKGFKSNVDNVSFKKGKAVNNGTIYDVSIPDGNKSFRRVDGNHRLKAFEKLFAEGQAKSSQMIPFCIILFSDIPSLKDEKIIFHNINSKAIPLRSEELLKSVLTDIGTDASFTDQEIKERFGLSYYIARKISNSSTTIINALKSIEWAKVSILSVLVDLIEYVQEKTASIINSEDKIDMFKSALKDSLEIANAVDSNTLFIPAGLLFLLTAFYYKNQTITDYTIKVEDKKLISNFIEWAKKYSMFNMQSNNILSIRENADCLESVYNQFLHNEKFTIFLSRCFASQYDENENAIKRAIKSINEEKKTTIQLKRVDNQQDGVTGQISDRVFKEIEDCGLVIADLSSGKPNMPHEIGYAMGLKKGIIIIHNGTNEEAEAHTPSNIRMYEQIRFNNNYTVFEQQIKQKIIDFYKL